MHYLYDHPARMYYKSIEIAPEKTYSSILSTLQSKLGKFDSKEIAELTSTDTINFEEIGNKKQQYMLYLQIHIQRMTFY